MKPTASYDHDLIERLKDPEYAAEFLNACLLEDHLPTLLLGLRTVAQANGGLSRVSRASGLNRVHLYRMLNKQGNPQITSLQHLLGGFGLHLAITPVKRRPKRMMRHSHRIAA